MNAHVISLLSVNVGKYGCDLYALMSDGRIYRRSTTNSYPIAERWSRVAGPLEKPIEPVRFEPYVGPR